jgi:phage tail sheath gpL-like
MAKVKILINSTNESASLLAEQLEVADSTKAAEGIQGLINYLRAAKATKDDISIKVESGVAAASGTVTCASVQALDTVTIAGVVLTAVSGAPAANEFDISGTNTQAATSLKAAINANATLAQALSADSAIGVVTITCLENGDVGNLVTLASSDGTRLAVSAARLASGADDSSSKTYSV